MRTTLLTASTAVLAIGLLGSGTGSGTQAHTIHQVSWLQGCWNQVTGQRVVEEHWTAPRGGSMLGTGRTVRGDSLIEYEFNVLRAQDDRLSYEAHPSGQPTATFTASEVTPGAVTFENPAHDFPQRVGYRRIGADSLLGWIEGTIGGRVRRVEFPYARTGC